VTGNPFDEDAGDWQVVLDNHGRHALWRACLRLPAGWRIVFSATDRETALDHIELCSTGRGAARQQAGTAW
jgi:MbtH protein